MDNQPPLNYTQPPEQPNRYAQPIADRTIPPLHPYGLGGWLILVQIGLYASLGLGLYYLLTNFLSSFFNGAWEFLTSKGSLFYDPMWSVVLTFELIYNIIVIAFIIFILVQFYSKKSILPKLMIVLYIISILFAITDYVLINQLSYAKEFDLDPGLSTIGSTIGTALIWIPYFLFSERVQNTFVK